jgi:Acetyltransferase (GNAT) domain
MSLVRLHTGCDRLDGGLPAMSPGVWLYAGQPVSTQTKPPMTHRPSPRTVVTKAEARIIGWGGLNNDPFYPGWGVEISYYFEPAAWGRGYATELATACTSVADNVLSLPEVRAFARAENTSSRRVLEKAGFEMVRFVPELKRLLYRRRHPTAPLAASSRSDSRGRRV